MEFVKKKRTKPPVVRKLSVRLTSFVCLTASILATGGFKFQLFQKACMVYKYTYLDTLLLLHSTSMLSVLKMPLKEAVGGRALKVMEITFLIIEKSWKNHGIVFFEFLWEP